MDYFLTYVPCGIASSSTDRLEEDTYGTDVWPTDRVISFLENNLGLSKTHKIPGRIVKGHDESLYFWEELMAEGQLDDPFEVIHVDSHADLGLGCTSDDFLQGAFLTLPKEARRKVRDYEFGTKGEVKSIDIGDYLLWAVAYQMVSKITYCANPNGDKNDYIVDTLKDFHEEYVWDKPVSQYIQLKYNAKMRMPDYNDDEDYKSTYLAGCTVKDPEVELRIIPTIEGVRFNGDFDYAVMAQSPNYTPESADFIMDIFKEYIEEI